MIAEIRRLDPKPGRAFGAPVEPPAIPDVFVTAAPDNSWRVELNSEALPRVLVNETYAARIKRHAGREEDRQFLTANLQTANWLTKSLEQRARTILNVASEIVRRQDGFLVAGVAGLRPLNLKTVADAIGVHESTVSRATSNKFIQTPRGLFEMKYFFTTPIASAANGADQAHSAESVRFKIKQMIDAEDPARGALRRRDRRPSASGGHRRRPSHRRQVSRQSAHSLVGRAAAGENDAISPVPVRRRPP